MILLLILIWPVAGQDHLDRPQRSLDAEPGPAAGQEHFKLKEPGQENKGVHYGNILEFDSPV